MAIFAACASRLRRRRSGSERGGRGEGQGQRTRSPGAEVQGHFSPAGDALALNPGGLIIAAEAYTLNRALVDNQFDELDPAISNRVIKGKDVMAADYLSNIRAWEQLRNGQSGDARRRRSCPATMAPAPGG